MSAQERIRQLPNVQSRRAAPLELLTSPVIHRPDGSPIVNIRKAWARACKAAGCPSLRFHDLRAAAASNLIEAGVPQIEAQKILGHKTAAMFARYHIVSTDRLAEIGRMVEARTGETKEQERVN